MEFGVGFQFALKKNTGKLRKMCRDILLIKSMKCQICSLHNPSLPSFIYIIIV